MPLYIRFWLRVEKRGADDCWRWGGKPRPDGYGELTVDGRRQLAHRVAFLLTHGRYPFIGRHSCDNRICVNPSHVLDGTKRDNSRDMVLRNPTMSGADASDRALRGWATRRQKARVLARAF